MKELPVVQPDPPKPPDSDNQTAALVPDTAQTDRLKPEIVKVLSKIFDPEIPVDIYSLGLIYDVLVDASGVAGIRMTLTAPGCPAAQILPVQVREQVLQVPGVADVKVDVVWDPPWDKDKMSDAARLTLGLF